MTEVLRYAAFTDTPDGRQPGRRRARRRRAVRRRDAAIAADVGYSETAFVDGDDIRYFSPLAEVPFCGHATIATGVAIAERAARGELAFNTRSGPVPVLTRRDDQGRVTATLTSVPPRVEPLADADLDELLAALGWAAR